MEEITDDSFLLWVIQYPSYTLIYLIYMYNSQLLYMEIWFYFIWSEQDNAQSKYSTILINI